MKLDQTTLKLFSPFYREVATPSRRVVHSLGEFSKFIDENNGRRDVFTSVYPLTGEIDKIFVDIDNPNISEALQDAKILYSYLRNEGYAVIPVVSGKKGFHLYLLLKPKKYENAKELLTAVTYSILARAFNGKTEVSVDPHPIGDVRRICRVPNTLRPPENLNYCTYLPPNGFLDMTEKDIAQHMKSPHHYNYDFNGDMPTLEDFEVVEGLDFEKFSPVGNQTPIIPSKGDEFLKRVLRPCLYRHMIGKNPKHAVRTASTADLFNAGFDAETIFNAYARLGWSDWNPEVTRYQIEHCRYLKPYSCRKLRKLGIPSVCCIG